MSRSPAARYPPVSEQGLVDQTCLEPTPGVNRHFLPTESTKRGLSGSQAGTWATEAKTCPTCGWREQT